MKLYVYDHCPYCVRTRMIFGLKNIPFELAFFLNDDFKSPESMIGKKMAPILQKDDGSYMPESLDIVNYVDSHDGSASVFIGEKSPKISEIIHELEENDYKLIYPRYVKIGLPEFATVEAVNYFVTAKTKKLGSFDDCLAQTDDLVKKIVIALNKLEVLIKSADACNGMLSLDDICLFPVLRNLTCVKALIFPPKVKAYLESMAKQSKVNLYFDRAI